MRLLIVSNNLHIGGVQKSLVSLLHNIKDKYDVNLLLFNKSGEYLCDLPDGIEVIQVDSFYKYLGMTFSDVKGFKDKLCRNLFAAMTRLVGRRFTVSVMSLLQKKIKGFDVAISFLHSGAQNLFYGGCNEFVLRCVKADKKITFLHCDFKAIGADYKYNINQYSKFDMIAACSEGCKNSFLSACPQLEYKTKVVPNCHLFENITSKSCLYTLGFNKNTVNIVTVSRLGKEKGVLRAVRVFSKLKDIEKQFHYYIIGDGIERKAIEELIDKEQLSDVITLAGELDNPYPYMKNADLLLIPSFSEAAPIVIDEAASLGTPILSVLTSSAKEMIQDRGYGFVCDNSEESLENSIRKLILNKNLIEDCKNSLIVKHFDNAKAIEMFDNIVKEKGNKING